MKAYYMTSITLVEDYTLVIQKDTGRYYTMEILTRDMLNMKGILQHNPIYFKINQRRREMQFFNKDGYISEVYHSKLRNKYGKGRQHLKSISKKDAFNLLVRG